jgi:hypothetical protein
MCGRGTRAGPRHRRRRVDRGANADALERRTAAFGLNFIVPLMDRGSLELAVERTPYIDFFLADPTPANRRAR